MKRRIAVTLLIVSVVVAVKSLAEDYTHAIKLDNMAFHWRVAGNNLAIKVSAKTKGWVGVGINPVKMMQGANYIVGYVEDGNLRISDEFGIRTTGHAEDKQRGGLDSLVSSSGTENGNLTTLQFTIPLNSGDKTDTAIDPVGKTIILLAHGPRDSFRIGHSYYRTLEVNLTNGSYKIINNH